MSTQHSPLPWRLFNSDDIVDAHGLLVADFGGCRNGDANALQVVTACNAFPALVEALKAVVDPSTPFGVAVQQARAVLAQVER